MEAGSTAGKTLIMGGLDALVAGNYKGFVAQHWKWELLMQIPVSIQFITMATDSPKQFAFIAQGGLCSVCCSLLEKKECTSFLQSGPKYLATALFTVIGKFPLSLAIGIQGL